MDWFWWVIWYLLVGLLLGEGTIYHHEKQGKVCPKKEYLIAVFVIPAFMIIYLPYRVVIYLLRR